MKKDTNWARLLAYVTGLVNQELLLQNEYLAAENRILRSHLPARLLLSDRSGPHWLKPASGWVAKFWLRWPALPNPRRFSPGIAAS